MEDAFEDWDDHDDTDDGWQHGECDRCGMAPGEVIEPLGIRCACSIGQGAPPDACVCGPADNTANVRG